MIRLSFVLRRKTDRSRTEFQQYWREVHGPLVAGYAAALNMHRYVQVHTLDDPVNDQLAAARGGMEPPYDGVAEVWWRNREALVSALDTSAGRDAAKALVEDEARFIDLVHSPLWLNYEYPQVNPIPEEMVAREHGPLVKIFFCLRHPEHLSLDEAQLYWRTNHGPIIRGVATGMRMQRYFQVHRFEDDLEAQLHTRFFFQTDYDLHPDQFEITVTETRPKPRPAKRARTSRRRTSRKRRAAKTETGTASADPVVAGATG